MKERPILFNGEMVRAILDGRKTMTRRPVKPQPGPLGIHPAMRVQMAENPPLGTIGDRLWVRETWRCHGGREYEYQKHQPSIRYRADAEPVEAVCNEWTPSIHMPRWASRITLEITGVRVERVQEMEGMDAASSDALKEGVHRIHHEGGNYYYSAFRNQPDPKNWTDPCLAFKELWQSIYTNWDANPWVWVYEFRRVNP